MDDVEPFQQKMLEIGDRYLRRTAMELGRLRESMHALKVGEHHRLREVVQIAHKVHGSGAMFGFHEVSDAAGALEHLAEPYLERAPVDWSELIELCELLTQQLDDELHRACARRGVF